MNQRSHIFIKVAHLSIELAHNFSTSLMQIREDYLFLLEFALNPMNLLIKLTLRFLQFFFKFILKLLNLFIYLSLKFLLLSVKIAGYTFSDNISY